MAAIGISLLVTDIGMLAKAAYNATGLRCIKLAVSPLYIGVFQSLFLID